MTNAIRPPTEARPGAAPGGEPAGRGDARALRSPLPFAIGWFLIPLVLVLVADALDLPDVLAGLLAG
jgi:hypothetical protein